MIPGIPQGCTTIPCNLFRTAAPYIIVLATITIIGGVIGALALNGINLGPVNSLAAAVGSTSIYTSLGAGAVLLLVGYAVRRSEGSLLERAIIFCRGN